MQGRLEQELGELLALSLGLQGAGHRSGGNEGGRQCARRQGEVLASLGFSPGVVCTSVLHSCGPAVTPREEGPLAAFGVMLRRDPAD